MTVKQLFDIIPDTTNIIIYDRDKEDTAYEGQVLFCRVGYKEREVKFMRVVDKGLQIEVEL